MANFKPVAKKKEPFHDNRLADREAKVGPSMEEIELGLFIVGSAIHI